jgi:predicted HTH domain antitoxin
VTQVVLDFDARAISALRKGPGELTREVRTAAVVQRYAEGRLSQSKAAGLLGVSRAVFLNEPFQRRVPAYQGDVDDLREELRGISSRGGELFACAMTEPGPGGSPRLRDYPWQLSYSTSAQAVAGSPVDILHQFYIPVLKRCSRHDRVAGYFRSASLAAASQGLSALVGRAGRFRRVVGADLDPADIWAVLEGAEEALAKRLTPELEHHEAWHQGVQPRAHPAGGGAPAPAPDRRRAAAPHRGRRLQRGAG